MAKRITREQMLGADGVELVGRRFLHIGFPWHPTNAPLDAGIDGFVEIRDRESGEATNAWVAVQSKARTRLERDTGTTFEFTCTRHDLDYWRRGNMPVLLVVSRPDQNEAWWVSVKDYFKDPNRQRSRRIVFDKAANALTPASADQLLQLVQRAGAGTYFRPAPRREQLHANLLKVTRLPSLIYRAETAFTDAPTFRDRLKEQVEFPPREWVLHDAVYSVHDLRDEPWASACDVGTVETFEAAEWAATTDPDRRRLFVWLLNECLRSFAGKIGLRYAKDDDALFYKATRDLSPKVKRYRSRRQWAERTVFRDYRSKRDPSKLLYYRHVGFEPRFRRFDGRWWLQINPTYLFTSDGRVKHPYHQEYLAKIKSIEGSGAVGGTVVMFAWLLRDRDDLFANNYPHLGFGDLLGGELEVGIDDKMWARQDPGVPPAEAPVEDPLELAPEDAGAEEDAGLYDRVEEGGEGE